MINAETIPNNYVNDDMVFATIMKEPDGYIAYFDKPVEGVTYYNSNNIQNLYTAHYATKEVLYDHLIKLGFHPEDKNNTPEPRIKIGDIVIHFKHENDPENIKNYMWRVINIAKHTETDEMMVVYQSITKPENIFVRPYDMFMSKVDKAKYPEILQTYRLETISDYFKNVANNKKVWKSIISKLMYAYTDNKQELEDMKKNHEPNDYETGYNACMEFVFDTLKIPYEK